MSDDFDEADGIAAIVYLQGLAGIVESEEKARAGWRAMSREQQFQTLCAQAALLKGHGLDRVPKKGDP